MQEWVKQIKRALDNYTEASNPTKDAVFQHLLRIIDEYERLKKEKELNSENINNSPK